MPYTEFRDGLCAAHKDGNDQGSGAPMTPSQGTSVSEDYLKALAQRSSHVESILTHALLAGIGQELWKRDPWKEFQVFRTDVDDAGFDFILAHDGKLRYVQLKQTHTEGNTVKYSIRQSFSKIPGSCVVVVVFNGDTLQIDHFLFYGRTPSEPMPDIGNNPVSISPGRRTKGGEKKLRNNYRDVQRSAFIGSLMITELVDRLFQRQI